MSTTGTHVLCYLHSIKTFEDEFVSDGTTFDVLSQDWENGNFDTAHLVFPDGKECNVHYTGPVAEGYISPFEQGE